MPMFGSQWLANAGSYKISQSCRFNDGDSPELSRTYTLTAPWTLSAWVKRGELTAENLILGASGGEVHFNADDTLEVEGASSTAVFRDPSAWYHIHASNNGLYVNGVLLIAAGSVTTTDLSNAKLFDDFDGYVAEVHLQAGTSAYTVFGEVNDDGVWVPKADTAGDTYLTFADSSDFGVNSGTGAAWTTSGLAAADQMSDTPTDNFPTFSNNIRGLESYSPSTLTWGDSVNISDGGLKVLGAAAGANLAGATMAFPTSGKYYFEATFIGADTSYFGISPLYDESKIVWYRNNGWTLQNATAWTESGGATYTDTDVLAISVNMDDLEAKFYKNNALQITISLTAGVQYIPTVFGGSSSLGFTVNFGASAFTYTPPTGFVALSTDNLPAPTVTDGTANFQTTLYTGNGTAIGSGGQAVSQSENSTFQPDFVWIKGRSGATEHVLTDATRGVTKELHANDTGAEETVAEGLTTFGSAGFTVGSDGSYNTNTATYAAWQWKAGTGAGSSNTDGSINTTTTSVNTAAGISISTYSGDGNTGATVGHGLGVKPAVVIVKPVNAADNWIVSDPRGDFADKLILNDTEAATSATNFVNAASSTTVTFGSDRNVNNSGWTFVAYAFAQVVGFSRFGEYIGNADADGPFVSCGFKPAFVMVKEASSADDWLIYDSVRDPYNVAGQVLRPDNSTAEFDGRGGSRDIDLVSNGFKFRSSNATMNGSGVSYAFFAFAEHPFGGDGAAPATAR